MPSLTPILRIRSLSKSYTKGFSGHETTHTVLRNLNLDVYAAERLAIFAPKGSGKTTLLYCLAGILRPTSGTIHWHLPQQTSNPTPDIAYIPERSPYYNFLTVAETLDYYVTATNLTHPQRSDRIAYALYVVGLTLAQHVQVRDLSPNALRRLRIAQALVGAPQVILLDELISTIDPPAIPQFQSIFHTLSQSGITLIMTTHNPEAAKQLATRVVPLTTHGGHSGAVIRLHPFVSRIPIPMS